MDKQVTIQPSGHSFPVEENDSILQAGLKAGFALPYGCSNGSCGVCRARRVSGDVVTVKHSDYRFTPQEKTQNYLLTCVCSPASGDLVLDVAEAGSVDEIPEQQIPIRIKSVVETADDLLIVQAQTPRSQRFRFLAGQSVRLDLNQGEDSQVSRSLPVASCPCDDRNLEFHIPRRADDQLFERLTDPENKVKELTLTGPTGDFVLHEKPGSTYIFIAEDAGFAPVRSLIEHVMSLDEDAEMSLYWRASFAGGHYMENLCRAWADALDNFSYSLLDASDSRRADQIVRNDVSGYRDSEIYIAGSNEFVSEIESGFQETELPPVQLYSNRV